MYRFNLQEGIPELDAHFLQLAEMLYYFFPFSIIFQIRMALGEGMLPYGHRALNIG